MFFHFCQEKLIFAVIFSEFFSSSFLESLGWLNESKFFAIKLESGEDSPKSLLGKLFGFDCFDEIGEIQAFEFFHGLDKVAVLGFSENGEGLAEFINGFDHFRA